MYRHARQVAAVLATLGNPQIVTSREVGVLRNDAGETVTFTRKLEYVLAQTFDRKYPDLKARTLIPVDTTVPSGAESFVWRSYDYAGMAKIISNFADDLPLVDVMAGEASQLIKSLGDAFSYTSQEVRASQMAGTQLDVRRATAARRAMENAVEVLAAKGSAVAGLPGFLNHPNVTVLTAPGDITGGWTTATPAQMLADLNTMVRKQVEASKEVFKPDTLLLPTTRFELVASTVMQAGVDTRTVLRVFLENQVHIRNVESWAMLDTADSAGTGPRAVVYNRSPDNLGLIIPQDFEQFPPQAKNLAFFVPCHMRIGGVVIYYPLSITYVDGI